MESWGELAVPGQSGRGRAFQVKETVSLAKTRGRRARAPFGDGQVCERAQDRPAQAGGGAVGTDRQTLTS